MLDCYHKFDPNLYNVGYKIANNTQFAEQNKNKDKMIEVSIIVYNYF